MFSVFHGIYGVLIFLLMRMGMTNFQISSKAVKMKTVS